MMTKKKKLPEPAETNEAKKHICEVCGRGFRLTKDKHYIAKKKANDNALFPQFDYLDAFDCPYCGSQYLAKFRLDASLNTVPTTKSLKNTEQKSE